MLKVSITARLFLTLLIVSMLTAVGVGLATRWSFQRGFQGYLNEVEARRMEAMAYELGRAYQAHGNWDFIRGNREAWERTTGAIGRERATAPHQGGDSIYYAVSGIAPRRLGLVDPQGRHLAGNVQQGDDLRYQPVLVDGKAVGTLEGAPLRGLQEEANQGFLVQQRRDSVFIAATALVLAGLVAWLLSRSFVAPTRRLIVAAGKVAAGDYAVRVPHGQRDELDMLARNFNTMASTLESNEALRRHFMADLSHELRTPLAILQAQLEAMQDGIEPTDAGSVSLLMDEVATLSRLVEDMRQITLSEVGAFNYRFEPLDLPALLASELHKWREPLLAQGIAVHVDAPAVLRLDGDMIRLRQLLRNLINNVLRHAEGASVLRLDLRNEQGYAVLRVIDNGAGIPDAALSLLFERFWRGDRARSRATGGSGLGLAICRTIADAHGGDIVGAATPEGGLSIQVRLPLMRAAT
jgi:two-component system sensor histidine kinase BaeS